MELKPGYKQTEVGVIPEDWEVKKISSIAGIFGGGTPNTSVAEYWDGQIPWVAAGDVSQAKGRYIRDTTDYISELGLASCAARIMPIDTTIIIARGATVGRMAQLGRAMSFNQTCYGLFPIKGIDQNYLYYAMLFFVNSMKALTYGTIFGTITTNSFEQWKIPLPPTRAEQQAIAEALSDADALIESLEQLIAKKRQIKQGAMQELLRPKDGWAETKLGCLGVFLKGSGVRKNEAMSGDLPCIRYGEIYTKHNNYIKRFYSWISKDVAATAKRLRCGDLLFAGSGETKEEIGKCVAFVDSFEAYAGGDIVILRPENVSSVFMGYYLNTGPINRQKASKGQGDAVVHIGSSALADIDITIPNPEEQTTIATTLSDMDAEIAALEEKLAKARQIKQGMMQELLTGRIRLR